MATKVVLAAASGALLSVPSRVDVAFGVAAGNGPLHVAIAALLKSCSKATSLGLVKFPLASPFDAQFGNSTHQI